ncbi:hypothetical protein CTAM01_01398 [Colletotrichum tamarilloi]|uniref:Uncharacterized protein n=1 Tax=Colletotrichum tamarilloi TaxID=1209934 RepID=A0ABQ9RR76_9PEZI|nr:uncharacterized protein CTAM01_01398 [Colletotrichum tamarilloi]KAK1510825.1 hypothetical protein CTAM01_01398 [Colletotrichum tamarilloi]
MSGIQYPTSGWTIEFEVQPWRQRLLHFHAPVVYLPLFLCTSHPLSESESPSPSPGPRQSEAIAKPNGHFSRSQSPPQPCKVPSRLTPSLGSRVDHDHAPASQACTRGGPGGELIHQNHPLGGLFHRQDQSSKRPYVSSQQCGIPAEGACLHVQLPNRLLSGPF